MLPERHFRSARSIAAAKRVPVERVSREDR